MIFPLIAIVVGVLIGLAFGLRLPAVSLDYVALAMLAGLDALVGGWRARQEGKFDQAVFLTGVLMNTSIAVALVYAGDVLQINLYIAAVVAFGLRIFTNLGVIRRHWLGRAGHP